MTANAIAFIFGGPLSGWLVSHTLIPGLHGWQQMFVLEGIPACLLGFVVLFYLPDGPKDATWLTETEKAQVIERLAGETVPHREHRIGEILKIIPSISVFCAVYFFLVTGMYGISMWLPALLKSVWESGYAHYWLSHRDPLSDCGGS